MNNQRRKILLETVARLEELQEAISDIRDEIETVRDGEQDTFDSLPEGLQGTARGEEMESNVDNLNEVIDALEEFDIDGMIEKINETIG